MTFLQALEVQRWDDHRYYHHSDINRALHAVSAMSFIVAYALLLIDPPLAALFGWLVAMISRQIGHAIFEPKTFDAVNNATHAYKEAIKVGYNLKRKAVLLAVWALSPLIIWFDATLFGMLQPYEDSMGFARNVGWMWLGLAALGLLFRTVQLFIIKDVQTGLVWVTKILTDPFHDLKLYAGSLPALWGGRVARH